MEISRNRYYLQVTCKLAIASVKFIKSLLHLRSDFCERNNSFTNETAFISNSYGKRDTYHSTDHVQPYIRKLRCNSSSSHGFCQIPTPVRTFITLAQLNVHNS
uniref:Uncharacterized protein n=1 Tax=Cacopsylla melanoneura TaxID=428564 RepID=A0A8D8PNA5_9HEMI